MSDLADELETYFLLKDFKLNIDGKPTSPTAADLDQIIEKAADYVKDGGVIEVARLVIIKPQDDNKYDVYVHVGTVGEENAVH